MIEDGFFVNDGDLYPQAGHGTSVMFMRSGCEQICANMGCPKARQLFEEGEQSFRFTVQVVII